MLPSHLLRVAIFQEISTKFLETVFAFVPNLQDQPIVTSLISLP